MEKCDHRFINIHTFTDRFDIDCSHCIHWCRKCGTLQELELYDGRVIKSKTRISVPERDKE